jgi:N,N'-diacetyllegionaminate synthase
MGKERKAFLAAQPSVLGYEPVEAIAIGDRVVGKGHPALVIAEVGANHRGDIKVALHAIDNAADAGADAVKFQHLTGTKIAADTVIYEDWNEKPIGPLSGFYKTAEMPYEWTSELVAHAKKRGILFLSTPFDTEAVDVLAKAGVAAYKVASYELTDDILLRSIARQGKPIIISTGMAYLEEVAHAVRVIQEEGNTQIAILHCVSIYPPKSFADLNLRAITTLQGAFKLPIGYSDHSKPPYTAAPIAAITLGACIIEKHVTDTRTGGSNDDPNSLEPAEFKRMIEEIRNAEAALSGSGIKQPVVRAGHEGDEIFDRYARRSVYAARALKAGEVLTEDMVVTLRPWGGIAPKDLGLFLGKKLTHDVAARAPLTPDAFFAS